METLGKITKWVKELILEEDVDYPTYQSYNYFDDDINNPCARCANNPLNNPFASGFCNCALPALKNITY